MSRPSSKPPPALSTAWSLYNEMNEAYAEFFPGPKPARAMVRFGADIPGVLVAIEAIALA